MRLRRHRYPSAVTQRFSVQEVQPTIRQCSKCEFGRTNRDICRPQRGEYVLTLPANEDYTGIEAKLVARAACNDV